MTKEAYNYQLNLLMQDVVPAAKEFRESKDRLLALLNRVRVLQHEFEEQK